MPTPPKSRQRSALQKVFILDAQGGYAGELVFDQDCVVEFGDFLSAVPERGLADRQSIFIGEYNVATALHGERMSLVLISKGDVQPSEIAWGKAALTATETHLAGEAAGTPAVGPDKAVMENLAQALEKREVQIAEREKGLAATDAAAAKEVEDRGRARDGEIQDLQKRLADAEAQRDTMRAEMRRIVQAPPAGPDVAAERNQLEADKKAVQRRALDLHDREEKVRQMEAALAAEREKVEKVRKENEALLAKIEAGKKPAPEYDVAAAKREMDMRVKILQQKALDLLDREEKLRKREEELQQSKNG